MKTFNTKAIVLKTTPYGDTSLIVLTITESFGVQSYLVKGVRKATKTQSAKVSYFQPGAILDMVVYHNPMKQLNFVKEYRWSYVYQNVMSNVVRNAAALFCIEVTIKCLKQPDDNPEYYELLENYLKIIDVGTHKDLANAPLSYSFSLLQSFGLTMLDNYNTNFHILDLYNGNFTDTPPSHIYYVTAPVSDLIGQCLQNESLQHLATLPLNGALRKQILEALEIFFQLHISEFGKLKSLSVLSAVLS